MHANKCIAIWSDLLVLFIINNAQRTNRYVSCSLMISSPLECYEEPEWSFAQRVSRSLRDRKLLTLSMWEKLVHSLSVGLLNAFVCICPSSSFQSENRIPQQKTPPAHETRSSLISSVHISASKRAWRTWGIRPWTSSALLETRGNDGIRRVYWESRSEDPY